MAGGGQPPALRLPPERSGSVGTILATTARAKANRRGRGADALERSEGVIDAADIATAARPPGGRRRPQGAAAGRADRERES